MLSDKPIQALSVTFGNGDNQFSYCVLLFHFVGDNPAARVLRLISEGTIDGRYEATGLWKHMAERAVISNNTRSLAQHMNVFYIPRLKPGDPIDKLYRYALKV